MNQLIKEYKKNELKIIRLENEKKNIKDKTTKTKKKNFIKKDYKKEVYNQDDSKKQNIKNIKKQKLKIVDNNITPFSHFFNIISLRSNIYLFEAFVKSGFLTSIFYLISSLSFLFFNFYFNSYSSFIGSVVLLVFLNRLLESRFKSNRVELAEGLVDFYYFLSMAFFVLFFAPYNGFNETLLNILKVHYGLFVLYQCFCLKFAYKKDFVLFSKYKKTIKRKLLFKIDMYKESINKKGNKSFIDNYDIHFQSEYKWLIKNKEYLTIKILNDYEAFCEIHKQKEYTWNKDLKKIIKKCIDSEKNNNLLSKESAIKLLEKELESEYEIENK